MRGLMFTQTSFAKVKLSEWKKEGHFKNVVVKFFDHKQKKEYTVDECCVCLESLSLDEKETTTVDILKLSCGHIFHKQCFEEWCKHSSSRTCPFCRKEDFPLERCQQLFQNFNNSTLEDVILRSCKNFYENPNLSKDDKNCVSVTNLIFFILFELLRSQAFEEETCNSIKHFARYLYGLRIVQVVFDRQYDIMIKYPTIDL